jgi:hypothetical protein
MAMYRCETEDIQSEKNDVMSFSGGWKQVTTIEGRITVVSQINDQFVSVDITVL